MVTSQWNETVKPKLNFQVEVWYHLGVISLQINGMNFNNVEEPETNFIICQVYSCVEYWNDHAIQPQHFTAHQP